MREIGKMEDQGIMELVDTGNVTVATSEQYSEIHQFMQDRPAIIGRGSYGRSPIMDILNLIQMMGAYQSMPMPKIKPKPTYSKIVCGVCGRGGQLRKVDKDKYRCVNCVKKEL
jgi:hypothetical protein